MLVPSEESSIDSERQAGVKGLACLRSVSQAAGSAGSITVDFSMVPSRTREAPFCSGGSHSPGMAEYARFALYSCTIRHISLELRYDAVMTKPDFNLLVTLDVLLAEGSVARAAG